MVEHERFEVPLTVELTRFNDTDVTDNVRGTRTVERSVMLSVEPGLSSLFGASMHDQVLLEGWEAQTAQQLRELDAVPVEDAARSLLDERFNVNYGAETNGIVRTVGREKAQSALGGFAAGVFFAGGGAAIAEGFSEGRPYAVVGGAFVSLISLAFELMQRAINQEGMFDKERLESELAVFEGSVKNRQLLALVKNKLRSRKEQAEVAVSEPSGTA